ncbi:MAG: tetratricopeptide repeat protein [bacterium]
MIAAGVFLLALVLRLLYITQADTSPFFDALGLDAKYYDDEAQRILAGTLPREPYFMGPLYSYFLAAVYAIAGHSYDVVRALQCVMGAATALAAWAIARRLAGPTAALLAGLLVAIYPEFIFYSGSILYPTLAALLDTAVIFFLVEHARSARARDLALGGFLLGLSAIGQATVLAVAPGVLVWLWFLERRDLRRALRRAAPFFAALAITILPVTARNLIVGGEPVLLTSNGGINFYIGNGAEANGGYVKPKGLDVYEDPSGRRMFERREGRPLSSREVDAIWMKSGRDAVTGDPARFASLLVRKAMLYWGAIELPQIESFEFQKGASPLVAALDGLPISFGLLGPLAALGVVLLVASARSNRSLRPMIAPPLLFIGLYSATIVIFFVISRYRLPILPALFVFAAATLVRGASSARQLVRGRHGAPSARALAMAVGALILFSVLVNTNPYDVSETSGFGQCHFRLGIIARQNGRMDDALAEYRRSIEYDPAYAPARMNLAEILLARQDLPGALAELREAVRIDPEYGRARYNLGLALALLGEWTAARPEFDAAVRLAPQSPDGAFGVGAASYVAGDYRRAVAAFESMAQRAGALGTAGAASVQALQTRARDLARLAEREARLDAAAASFGSSADATERAAARAAALWGVAGERSQLEKYLQSAPPSRDPVVLFHRGDLLVGAGRVDEGVLLLRESLSAAPALPYAHFTLGAVRILARDSDGAYREFSEEVRVNPSNSEAHFNLGLLARDWLKNRDAAIAHFRACAALGRERAAEARQLLDQLGAN